MVDMNFIARMAGVSPATVSRVLNKTKAVSPATEKRVLEVVARYHYTPNGFGRGLVTGHSHVLGVVTSGRMNMFQSCLFDQISRFAAEKKYSVVIFNTEDTFESRLRSFEVLQSQRVDAILCSFDMTETEVLNVRAKLNIPFLHAGDMIDGISLYETNKAAAFEVAEYLTRLNHKRIGVVFPPLGETGSVLSARCRGFLQALENYGCDVRQEYILKDVVDMADAMRQVLKIVRRNDRPTAIFCYSDEVAIGAMFSLIQNGFRIPEDISVVGFDGIPLGTAITPRLTTVVQNIDYMASVIVERMIVLIEGDTQKTNGVRIEKEKLFRLVAGESCCPPKSEGGFR